jgi:hypothetical protein
VSATFSTPSSAEWPGSIASLTAAAVDSLSPELCDGAGVAGTAVCCWL